MKAVIYARVSSTNDRQSTERQIADLTKYAEYKEMEISKVAYSGAYPFTFR